MTDSTLSPTRPTSSTSELCKSELQLAKEEPLDRETRDRRRCSYICLVLIPLIFVAPILGFYWSHSQPRTLRLQLRAFAAGDCMGGHLNSSISSTTSDKMPGCQSWDDSPFKSFQYWSADAMGEQGKDDQRLDFCKMKAFSSIQCEGDAIVELPVHLDQPPELCYSDFHRKGYGHVDFLSVSLDCRRPWWVSD